MIAGALLAVLLTQPAPIPAPKGSWLHVEVSEELDAELLRSLTVPGVVLWVSTRSNTLRASTVETLRQAESAFVQVHPPVTSVQARQLDGAARVGYWLKAPPWPKEGLQYRGPRRLAVELQGALDEAVARQLASLRPAWIRWIPDGEPGLLSFARLRSLPGAKVLRVSLPALPAKSSDCGFSSDTMALELEPASTGALTAPCGFKPRVRLAARSSFNVLHALAAMPAVEVDVEIGASREAALALQRILAELSGPRVP